MSCYGLTPGVHSVSPMGHFGLAANIIPISPPRSALSGSAVHRILRYAGGLTPEESRRLAARFPRLVEPLAQERLAMEAERESLDLKKVEYGGRRTEYNGVISGGIFRFL